MGMKSFAMGVVAAAIASQQSLSFGATPPDCAAGPTVAAIRDMYQEGVRNTLESEAANLQQPHERERVQRLARSFVAELKITVSEITSNGYDRKAERYTCNGRIGVIAPTANDGGFSIRSQYTTQTTQDDRSKFLVSIDEYQTLLRAVIAQGFPNYAAVKVKADAKADPNQEARFNVQARRAEEARSGMPASTASYAMGINVLRFTRVSDDALKFEYESDAPAGTCTASGVATVQGSSAAFQQSSQINACAIKFWFENGGRLEVLASGACIPGCPPNQHALGGKYFKRQTAK